MNQSLDRKATDLLNVSQDIDSVLCIYNSGFLPGGTTVFTSCTKPLSPISSLAVKEKCTFFGSFILHLISIKFNSAMCNKSGHESTYDVL